MNSIILSGRLTKKPELKQTTSNKSVCEFNLAINRGVKDENDNYVCDFINCRVWNKLAENFCKYQDKGDYVVVQGKMQIDYYNDKEGNKKSTAYVLVDNVEFTPRRIEKKEETKEENKSVDNWTSASEIEPDELPFY